MLPRRCVASKLRARTATITWTALPDEPVLQKLVLGCLAVAGVVGMAYGFSSLLDLVQNWVSLNGGILH